jgi:hypothetical protein
MVGRFALLLAMQPNAAAVAFAAPRDITFSVPQQDYTLVFAAARGGCLSSVRDAVTGAELLASPLQFNLSGAVAPPGDPPCSASATLRILHRNETALSFTSTTVAQTAAAPPKQQQQQQQQQQQRTMRVDVLMRNYSAVLTHSGLTAPPQPSGAMAAAGAGQAWRVAGALMLSTPPNPWVPYLYAKDGAAAEALGTAAHSESVTKVSNWKVRVAVTASDGGGGVGAAACGVSGRSCCVVGSADARANTTSLTMDCDAGPFVVEFARLI